MTAPVADTPQPMTESERHFAELAYAINLRAPKLTAEAHKKILAILERTKPCPQP